MLRSKMDRKIAVFYFPRDHELRVLSSPNSDNLEEEHDHFWPCQLWSITPSTNIQDGRKRVFISLVKKKSIFYFPSFLTEFSRNLTYFMPSFLSRLQTCNNQLWKRGEEGCLGKKHKQPWVYHQQIKQWTWSNVRVGRGCVDPKPIELDLATHI